jgi:hypothetical protein
VRVRPRPKPGGPNGTSAEVKRPDLPLGSADRVGAAVALSFFKLYNMEPIPTLVLRCCSLGVDVSSVRRRLGLRLSLPVKEVNGFSSPRISMPDSEPSL